MSSISVTDIDLWDETAATAQPKWENRAKIIAHFIRPNDIVLDLGAGDRKLSKYLHKTCVYIPVDCTDKLPGTFVVDYNVDFRLPTQNFTVIVSAGFMEYLVDLDGFLKRLSSERDGTYFIFTISYGKGKSDKLHNKKSGDEAAAFKTQ